MPRPNRGAHLWLDETGIWNVRWFSKGRRVMRSLGTTDHDTATQKLKEFDGAVPKSKTVDDSGCIYAIGWDEGGPIKIGKAKTMRARLDILQTGCPYQLRILHHSRLYQTGAVYIERKIHSMLADSKMCGEWFNVSLEEAIDAIESCSLANDNVTARHAVKGRQSPPRRGQKQASAGLRCQQ